ncbi:hypothetical protein ACJRO7_003520 [Eucalyptus globulus]|uniref:Uncharacterized protein n=1 Tax=Eucalyptus globulus TaxID=34317 RepID=A0ABD3IW37_EUCGL
MASGSKLGHVAVVVTLCVLLLIAAASGCETGQHGCVSAKAGSFLKDSRKILRTFKRDGGTMIANEELRGVPSGPDPLHHHKGSPQRPQTP